MTMNTIKVATSTLVLLLTISVLSALPASDNDKSLNDLYESLLQREYTGPIPLSDHQVERKAVRSPSLRLRFGRRSDPDLLPTFEKRFFQEVNKKPIRSPSLRLRFGRRSDPMMPLRSDNIDYDNFDDGTLLSQYDTKRAPSLRLRFGRSSFPAPNELYDEYDYAFPQAEKRAPRLRWGRSGFPKTVYDEENELNELESRTADQPKRAPSGRLRWGRSAEENLKKLNEKTSGNNDLIETSTQEDLGVN